MPIQPKRVQHFNRQTKNKSHCQKQSWRTASTLESTSRVDRRWVWTKRTFEGSSFSWKILQNESEIELRQNQKEKIPSAAQSSIKPEMQIWIKILPPLNSTECQLFPSQNCDSDPDPSESIWERKLRAGSCWHANGRGGSQRKECISKADGHHEIENTNIEHSSENIYLEFPTIRKIATLEPFGLQLD